MKKYLNTVQQQIGILISLIGVIVILNNIIAGFIMGETVYENFIDPSVWLLFISILPFILSIFFKKQIFKILQVMIIILTGVMNILESYNEVFGPGLFLAAWLLMRHYGFFERYRKLKYISMMAFLIILTQISAYVHNLEGTRRTYQAGLYMLEYTTFIVIFILIIWNGIINEQKKLKVENKSLKVNYTRIRNQLIKLEEEQKPFNLKSIKITPAEERVIKTLTIYKASNREIAERLNIAESTVKLHLYNIYNKIGVDNRFAIIELCKYNYT